MVILGYVCVCVWALFELFNVCAFLMGLYQKKDSFFFPWLVYASSFIKKKKKISGFYVWYLC